MLLFRLFTFNNIIYYFTIFIMFILIFFLSYKYLYLEQSLFALTNKLNRMEIEYNNPSIYSNSSTGMNSAEMIMNEIFNDCCDTSSNTCKLSRANDHIEPVLSSPEPQKTQVIADEVEVINEIFDLKKEIDDKESIISANIGGGHATKKALMKLSLDKLKSKCEERKLSTDGTKNQLADRIIVHDNNVEITDITD